MISQIRGKLIEVEDDKVVVDVGGVGYEIEVASSVLDTLPVDKDQEISLVCHFVLGRTLSCSMDLVLKRNDHSLEHT